jgi:hypothetical protein
MKKIIYVNNLTVITYILSLISNIYLIYSTYMFFKYNQDFTFLFIVALFIDFYFIFYYYIDNIDINIDKIF